MFLLSFPLHNHNLIRHIPNRRNPTNHMVNRHEFLHALYQTDFLFKCKTRNQLLKSSAIRYAPGEFGAASLNGFSLFDSLALAYRV